VIGYNLGYEQLPLHLLITSYELNELGIDPYYFTLHVTVDNAGSGHAHKAVQALRDLMARRRPAPPSTARARRLPPERTGREHDVRDRRVRPAGGTGRDLHGQGGGRQEHALGLLPRRRPLGQRLAGEPKQIPASWRRWKAPAGSSAAKTSSTAASGA
jgi:hypothetical protein